MIEINLLPGARRGRRRAGTRRSSPVGGVSRIDRWRAVTGIILLFGAAGAILLLTRGGEALAEARLRLEELRADSSSYAGKIRNIDELQARRDSLSVRVSLIQEFDAARYRWPHLLDEVARATPDRVRITRLAERPVVPAGRGATGVTIEGRADDAFALTGFLGGLANSLFLADVRLVRAERMVEGLDAGEVEAAQRFLIEAEFSDAPADRLEWEPWPRSGALLTGGG